ncbi:MAG: GAF domain-containing sensor histidine kinase [Kouleothrix sp.]|nr:GAF domain-containing sensor histidine kinase [Kouleothrix sp.]
MLYQPIDRLMIQANFGRTPLSRPALLLANHYRLMVALLTCSLLLSQIPVVGSPAVVVAAAGLYVTYVAARMRLPERFEERFYRPWPQFWRAQAGIAAVTTLLLLLGSSGTAGMLWLLYLSALLLVSRYCLHHRIYIGVAAEVVLLIGGACLFELRHADLTTVRLLGELGTRIFGVLLPSFMIHYLARVDIVARQGAAVRNQVVQALLEQAVFETEEDRLWCAIRDACAAAVNAVDGWICRYDGGTAELQPVGAAPPDDGLAARAASNRTVAEESTQGLVTMAAPLFGQPGRAGPPLAVVTLRLRAAGAAERRAARLFLTDLIDHIWPICAYASIRQQFPLLDQSDNRDVYRLNLDEVLDVVLGALCHKLGFSFATISLVNEDTREIGTVRGLNVPAEWVAEARHQLDSHDIQADVIRSGRVEVIGEWDPRFDAQIWARHNHEQLVRVWVPLGRVGTIEAGFYKCENKEISRLLIEIVKRYARDVTVAIQNAQRYEREQRHAALMAQLHEVSCELQTAPGQRDEVSLLQQITSSARELLGASIVLLYPLDYHDGTLVSPICSGDIDGRQPLAPPNEHDNIVRHVAAVRAAYYQPDARLDPRLSNVDGDTTAGQRRRTFTVRQNIMSFAGVPLLARGKLFGVLCVNYRERHQFSAHDRRAIELFAQQAAAVIAGDELAREQERRRLEHDLHDSVKSSVRGLILFSRAATDALDRDPERARQHLHEIRRVAWGILADVDIILKGLAPIGAEGKVLQRFIREELRRLVGWNSSNLILDLDEDLPALPMPLTQTLLALMREATINALEHAQAQTIRVGLRCTGDRLQLTVSDDGRGFASEFESGEDHRGLVIMRERVKMIGGNLEIISSPGQGTTIWGDLPQ